MSLLKKFRKSRRAAKAELKAAKTKAKAEVKSADKARKRQQKLLANQEKQLVKSEEKGLKQRRKHASNIPIVETLLNTNCFVVELLLHQVVQFPTINTSGKSRHENLLKIRAKLPK